jgi:hypothetical protein
MVFVVVNRPAVDSVQAALASSNQLSGAAERSRAGPLFLRVLAAIGLLPGEGLRLAPLLPDGLDISNREAVLGLRDLRGWAESTLPVVRVELAAADRALQEDVRLALQQLLELLLCLVLALARGERDIRAVLVI